MRNLPLNSIRRFVNNGRVLRIAGTLLAALIICSCEEYPTPYEPGLYPRAAPAGWWNDEGASGSRQRSSCTSANRKLIFTRANIWSAKRLCPPVNLAFRLRLVTTRCFRKHADHVSSLFGDYVDDYGNVVRSNIDSRKDRRPKGTHFDGARMPYAMFFRGGYAMHQGYVPPFAASHGCIRLPRGMAARFFETLPSELRSL